MRRIKTIYHTLQKLKNASPKFHKGIISNCNKDLLNSISECVLKVLHFNIRLSNRAKRQLKNYKSSLRSLADRRFPKFNKTKLIVQLGGFLLTLLSAVLPTLANLLFRTHDK